MVAVAVAMSVIIFTWSQSFLSQTGEAASGQQAAQNIAAQSGILIEAVTATPSGSSSNGEITVYVRNVGSVSVTLGQVAVVGRSANAGFKTAIPILLTSGTTTYTYVPTAGTALTNTWTPADVQTKGAMSKIIIKFPDTSVNNYKLVSGDVVTIKVTTTAGTFAQASITVP